MIGRRHGLAIGLASSLAGICVALGAPAEIPPAAIVLPAPPRWVPETPPPPAALSPDPAPAPVLEPAPPSRTAEHDYSGIPSYDFAWPDWAETAWQTTADAVHDHLRIGLRYRRIRLDDDRRSQDDSFLGSITELNTVDDYEPITWLTFDWLFTPYVGARLAWEQVRAETQTSQQTASLNHSDGDVDLFGPSLMLLLRYPSSFRVTPTVGIGYAWLSATFEHNPIWHNGFGGENREIAYQVWVEAGSPAWPNGGYQRTITLDDTTAFILYGELAVRLTDRLEVHAFIQSMDVKGVDLSYELSFYGNAFRSEQAEFPMSHTAYGLGLRWTF